jgi:hypothetical protein
MAKDESKLQINVTVERKTTVAIENAEACRLLAAAVGCPDPKAATVEFNEYSTCYVRWSEIESTSATSTEARAEKEEPLRRVYVLTSGLVERVNAYREKEGLDSEVEAVRQLLDRALRGRWF